MTEATTEPCDLTATQARRLIGMKQLSPVELMQSCLARIDRVDGALNAIVTLDAEGALATARDAEAAVMEGLESEILASLGLHDPYGEPALERILGQ